MPNIPIIGLDIGTTTISAVVLEVESGRPLAVRNIPNDLNLPAEHPYEKMQDAGKLAATLSRLTDELLDEFPDVRAIGITGQMHGIVYLDARGDAVSPLFTWQDERAGVGSPSACEVIRERTAYAVSPGYGLATHFANVLQDAVPSDAVQICTIMDYIGMKLCGLEKPVTHTSNAAALGLFAVGEGRFDVDAVEQAGMDPAVLPRVSAQCEVIGHHRGIPVAVAIGDNQASFIGSVGEMRRSALANFGTGSQISLMTDDLSKVQTDAATEIRPFLENTYLVSGSALCGGRAYALLERFFRKFAVAAGLPDAEQYAVLNRLAAEGMAAGEMPCVQTTFCGTRNDPTLRGSIRDISQDNLTPEALIAGTLRGMAGELHEMFKKMPCAHVDTLIVSGNAARKNPALCRMLSDVFGMDIRLPAHTEEAAYGAAMFAALSAGVVDSFDALKNCIHYID